MNDGLLIAAGMGIMWASGFVLNWIDAGREVEVHHCCQGGVHDGTDPQR